MKISYVLQLKDFGIMIMFGIIIGTIYEFINIPSKIKFSLIYQIIADILTVIIFFATYKMLINYFNLGQTRLFLCIGYILGFLIEKITLGKLFAKGFFSLYNYIIKQWKKFLNCKLGRIIFK